MVAGVTRGECGIEGNKCGKQYDVFKWR